MSDNLSRSLWKSMLIMAVSSSIAVLTAYTITDNITLALLLGAATIWAEPVLRWFPVWSQRALTRGQAALNMVGIACVGLRLSLAAFAVRRLAALLINATRLARRGSFCGLPETAPQEQQITIVRSIEGLVSEIQRVLGSLEHEARLLDTQARDLERKQHELRT